MIGPLLGGVALVAAAAWLWRCLCLFPIHGWNEIRLMPTFMWVHGLSPYPAPGGGPATTWIYGPLPLALQLPATLAANVGQALLIAGIINLAVTAIAIAVVCALWPTPSASRNPTARLLAAAVCFALWPRTNFEFLQADNAAVAVGLLSLLCLQVSESPRSRWLAAAGCAAAIASKQSLLGLAAAQCLYLALHRDLRTGWLHALRVLALTGGIVALTAAVFGGPGVRFHLLTLPAGLPWAASLSGRLASVWPYLLVQGILPMAMLLAQGPQVWRRESPWLLPALAWISAWPLDLLGLFTTGGSINSLHGALLLLPPAAVLVMTATNAPRWHTAAATITTALLVFRLLTTAPQTWRPRSEALRQGERLARSLPGQVYFPWHPLISYYADGRFYHTEDGLFIHWLTGHPTVTTSTSKYLPAHLHAVAFLRGEMDWGIARTLIPGNAQESDFGYWHLYSWLPRTAAGGASPSPHS